MVRERDGSQSITVAGMNKKKAIPYIIATFGDVFSVDLGDVIPAAYSGRTFSQMIETPHTEIVDGVEHTEYSYHNIIPTTYRFGDTDEHLMYCIEAMEKVKERGNNAKKETAIDGEPN